MSFDPGGEGLSGGNSEGARVHRLVAWLGPGIAGSGGASGAGGRR